MVTADRATVFSDIKKREKKIVETSLVGIAANVILSIFKIVVGLISNSIAVILDAVNNLSDAASSLITIIGTKLSGKQADHKHPFGYGRLEYVTTIVIAALVLWAGISSLIESLGRIEHPEASSYSVVSLFIITVAIAVKFILGIYVKRQGKILKSDSLVASGTDSQMDAILSFSTLVAALISFIFNISIEPYVGALISIFIIKAGAEILSDAIAKILGERIDSDLADNIKKSVNGVEGVLGSYDLALNDYGPNRLTGSVHVEVPDTMCAREIDEMTRKIQERIFKEFGVTISTVGIYSKNQNDKQAQELRKEIEKIAFSYPDVIELHGFYLDESEKVLRFDLVIDYKTRERKEIFAQIKDKIQALCPDLRLDIVLDADISNSD